jgi:hypothetical protein
MVRARIHLPRQTRPGLVLLPERRLRIFRSWVLNRLRRGSSGSRALREGLTGGRGKRRKPRSDSADNVPAGELLVQRNTHGLLHLLPTRSTAGEKRVVPSQTDAFAQPSFGPLHGRKSYGEAHGIFSRSHKSPVCCSRAACAGSVKIPSPQFHWMKRRMETKSIC